MNRTIEIPHDLKKYREFGVFNRILNELGDEVIMRDSLYSGIFCEYVADLNRRVTWDQELVMSGIKKAGINVDSGLIIDMCCGDGRLARYLHREGYMTAGIDNSISQIEKAKLLDQSYESCTIDWRVADLLDSNTFRKVCKGWNVVAATTTAASINCFCTIDQLRLFLKNAQEVLGDLGGKFLLLPVFSDEAIQYFEKSFHGQVTCHPFKTSDKESFIAWTSLLFEKETRSLLQPTLATVPGEQGRLLYEFCFAVDRIWTSTEVLEVATSEGLKELFSLPSTVVGGGANQWPFTLICLDLN